MTDLVGVWVGAILTLLVFSYLLGDTPLFRLAQAIFVGVSVGYAATVAVYLVIVPKLVEPLAADPSVNWPLFVPLVLGVLLFAKLRPGWAPIGNLSIAFLFGVGGALAIGGALTGTLLPQLGATVVSFSPAQGAAILFDNLILVVGTIGAFLSFRFITSTGRPVLRALDAVARGWGHVGRWFVLIAFGAIFASTAVSRISILIGRLYYLFHDWLQVIK
ncbi:MAG: hypothetical protein M1482_01400 [Chloroflexi bacterium]|nr:hypothetical protein [Chloroflexota bacterium]